jgi:hypothetical protein
VVAAREYLSRQSGTLGAGCWYCLSDILGRWLVVPLAHSLGYFFAVMSLAPFARKQQIELPRLLILALLAAGIALIWSVIVDALGV